VERERGLAAATRRAQAALDLLARHPVGCAAGRAADRQRRHEIQHTRRSRVRRHHAVSFLARWEKIFPSTLLREPVDVARDGRGDRAFVEIATHERAVAAARIAVAACARRDDRDRLPGLQKRLRADRGLDARAVLDAALAALVTTEEAPRRGLSARAVDERVTIVVLGANLPQQS